MSIVRGKGIVGSWDRSIDGSGIALDTTNFDGNLSAADTSVQAALETLDELDAEGISVATTNFDGNLGSTENTVQKALDKLDDAGKLYFEARKASTGTIAKGSPVYVTGYNPSGYLEVEEAQANSAATMPASGLAAEAITNTATSRVLKYGTLTVVNTNDWNIGDGLWVDPDTPGTLTNVRVTGAANRIQKVGVVTRKNVSQGTIEVVGAGRTNDVPNITEDYLWIGDADGVFSEISLDDLARKLDPTHEQWVVAFNVFGS